MSTLTRMLLSEETWRQYILREVADDGTTLGAATLSCRRDGAGSEWVPMSIDWHLPERQYAATGPGWDCMALGRVCQSDGSCATATVVWEEYVSRGKDRAYLLRELTGWLPRWGYPEKYQSEIVAE